jgi:putative OmpL-like beta-barrel porin-2
VLGTLYVRVPERGFMLRQAGTLIALFQSVALTVAYSQSDPGGRQDRTNPPNASGVAPTDQKPAESTSQAAQAAPATKWSIGPVDLSGSIDGYYSFNANHPASGFNQLRNFDFRANQFSLNMAKLTMQHDADPIGFRVDLGFGRAFDTIHAAEQAPDIFRYLEQAFISVKPKGWGGFQADFGEFVTSAGAEVIETKDDWNYSRSLLFSWAIPYYHFGLRTSIPIGKSFSAGVQLVNGWNNIEDNNSGKTVGLTATYTRAKFGWTNTWYGGPEKAASNKGHRNLYDSVLTLTPTEKLNAYLNFDYGQERALDRSLNRWIGFAAAVRIAPTKWFAITPRGEYFYDATGFNTGRKQKLNEVTLTGEFKLAQGMLTRVEYRRDNSDALFFDRGATPDAAESQNTFLVGIVAFFGPKRQSPN